VRRVEDVYRSGLPKTRKLLKKPIEVRRRAISRQGNCLRLRGGWKPGISFRVTRRIGKKVYLREQKRQKVQMPRIKKGEQRDKAQGRPTGTGSSWAEERGLNAKWGGVY